MKRFMALVGIGIGLAVGSGLVYAFYTSEAVRLVTVGLAAFLLAAATIGGTTLAVNRQWAGAVGSSRTTHHHRYQLPAGPGPGAGRMVIPGQNQADGSGNGLLPPLTWEDQPASEADEVVV